MKPNNSTALQTIKNNTNPVQVAKAIQVLLDSGKYASQAELATSVGKERRWLSNTLCILRLPAELIKQAEVSELSRDTLILIARLNDTAKQKELIEMATSGANPIDIRTRIDRYKGKERSAGVIRKTSKKLEYLQNIKTDKDLEDLIDHLQGEVAARDKSNAELRSQIIDQTIVRKAIQECCSTIRTRPIRNQFKPSAKTPRASLVLQWGDWHIGEVVDSEEIGGRPGFNYDIARARMDLYIQQVSKWAAKQRELYHFDEIVIQGMADWTSGNIHDELIDTSEFTPIEQPLRAGQLLAESIATVRESIPDTPIRFVGVSSDNHGRLQKKPRAKKKWAWNNTLIVYDKARHALSEMDGFTWESGKDIFHLTSIQDIGFLMCHGDGIKGWMGIPYYGILKAVMKEHHIRSLDPHLKNFRYFTLGHFHTSMFCETIIMNGSLTGTTEFDKSCNRYSPPQQNAFLVSPEHGVFNYTSFDLTNAKPSKP